MLARVPWSPPVKEKPRPKRLGRDRRRHLVETTAFLLRLGEPTPFAFEGYCRHDLRSRLCLEGWGWADADTAAADIVTAALNQVGAKRPTWYAGQPEWTQPAAIMTERLRCLQCAGRLPEENSTFCCSRCRKAYRTKRFYQDNREQEVAKQRLKWRAWSAKQPEQDCPECSDVFRPNYPGQVVCSKRCAVIRMKAARRLANVRP